MTFLPYTEEAHIVWHLIYTYYPALFREVGSLSKVSFVKIWGRVEKTLDERHLF